MARKILLADDSVTAQNMGRKILADAGYEVITVNNGSAALKKIAEHKPDLIVLDVYMPGYSGLEVCQRLKEAQETARTPVLLTVGKLEPFKPEEARRVRADGFIVKPFEASELLSALSKLEDKIVPRGETSKPGRFARASAALDENRYERSTAVDEDQGWKNRIQFPTKKEKPEQNEVDDSAIYNPVNKDLRTTFDHNTPAPPQSSKAELRVDLGAFAPEGLPKDVTPEEIAALAAAAAQVKGKLAESQHDQAAPEAAKDRITASTHETKSEIKLEAKVETAKPIEQPTNTAPQALPEAVSQATVAVPEAQEPEAKQGPSEKIEASAANSGEPPKAATIAAVTMAEPQPPVPQPPAPSPAEVMAAIAGLEPGSGSSSAADSRTDSGTLAVDPRKSFEPFTEKLSEKTDDEPVTMAVAPQVGPAVQASRWSAVAVALAPDEAALSLELEMQKAYAAFAAAEAGHAAPAPAVATPTATAEMPMPTPAAVTDHGVAVPATAAPEAAQGLSAVASAATDAVSAAVQELEAKAAAHLAQSTPQIAESEPTLSAPVKETDSLPEVAGAISAAPEFNRAPLKTEAINEKHPEPRAEWSPVNTTQVDPSPALPGAPSAPEIQAVAVQAETQSETKFEARLEANAKSSPSEEIHDTPVADRLNEGSLTATHQMATSQVPERAPAAPEPDAKTPATTLPSHDSDIAVTTAAAWASWRQIRESSGSPKSISEKEAAAVAASPAQDAAMAVAAGAEKHIEDAASAQPNDEVASIVDSVLADLRPRIFEEISRKMGKK